MKDCKIRKFACLALCAMAAVVLRADALADGSVRKREIAVSVIGLDRPSLPPVAESVPKVVKYWIDAMDREIGNAPDMIVLPECCDTVPTESQADKAAWIRLRGDTVLDAVRKYYLTTFTVKINTNYKVLHRDENKKKFAAIVRKYGQRVSIRNPGSVGTATLLSNDPALPVEAVMREFSLESYTDYLNRSRRVRSDALSE